MEIKRIFDLLELFRDEYKTKNIVFANKLAGKWRYVSADKYIEDSFALAYGFLSLNLKANDTVITIIGNKPEWNIVDMALLKSNLWQVPVYPNISDDELLFIINHSDAKVCIADNNESFSKLKKAISKTDKEIKLFCIENISENCLLSKLFIYEPDSKLIEKLTTLHQTITEDDVATVIYTSGTTGNPKGVLLTHKNIVSNFTAVAPISQFNRTHRSLSILPLCHIYERMINYMYQYLGMSIYYVDKIDKTSEFLKDVRPHCICVVPRILEKIADKIAFKIRTLPKSKKLIAKYAYRVAINYDFYKNKKFFYRIQHQLLSKAVYKYWKIGLGNNLRVVVSGGAFLHPGLARMFWCMGIKLIEGYGLTETSPVVAVGTLDKGGCKFGTIGPALHGVELKIAEDGEILVKGPNVMKAYFKDEHATSNSFTFDNWFKTGDFGKIVDDKYLQVTGRKSENFKTSGGKFVTPQNIENTLRESPFIESVMIVGENLKYISALIVPDFVFLKSWCEIKNIKWKNNSKILKNKLIIKRFQEEIDKFNQKLGNIEKIKNFSLCPHPWTVESGELTPTLKLKRDVLNKKLKKQIKEMYNE